ncbi:unnamed protein product, partial [Choristocarpus tenellus]
MQGEAGVGTAMASMAVGVDHASGRTLEESKRWMEAKDGEGSVDVGESVMEGITEESFFEVVDENMLDLNRSKNNISRPMKPGEAKLKENSTGQLATTEQELRESKKSVAQWGDITACSGRAEHGEVEYAKRLAAVQEELQAATLSLVDLRTSLAETKERASITEEDLSKQLVKATQMLREGEEREEKLKVNNEHHMTESKEHLAALMEEKLAVENEVLLLKGSVAEAQERASATELFHTHSLTIKEEELQEAHVRIHNLKSTKIHERLNSDKKIGAIEKEKQATEQRLFEVQSSLQAAQEMASIAHQDSLDKMTEAVQRMQQEAEGKVQAMKDDTCHEREELTKQITGLIEGKCVADNDISRFKTSLETAKKRVLTMDAEHANQLSGVHKSLQTAQERLQRVQGDAQHMQKELIERIETLTADKEATEQNSRQLQGTLAAAEERLNRDRVDHANQLAELQQRLQGAEDKVKDLLSDIRSREAESSGLMATKLENEKLVESHMAKLTADLAEAKAETSLMEREYQVQVAEEKKRLREAEESLHQYRCNAKREGMELSMRIQSLTKEKQIAEQKVAELKIATAMVVDEASRVKQAFQKQLVEADQRISAAVGRADRLHSDAEREKLASAQHMALMKNEKDTAQGAVVKLRETISKKEETLFRLKHENIEQLAEIQEQLNKSERLVEQLKADSGSKEAKSAQEILSVTNERVVTEQTLMQVKQSLAKAEERAAKAEQEPEVRAETLKGHKERHEREALARIADITAEKQVAEQSLADLKDLLFAVRKEASHKGQAYQEELEKANQRVSEGMVNVKQLKHNAQHEALESAQKIAMIGEQKNVAQRTVEQLREALLSAEESIAAAQLEHAEQQAELQNKLQSAEKRSEELKSKLELADAKSLQCSAAAVVVEDKGSQIEMNAPDEASKRQKTSKAIATYDPELAFTEGSIMSREWEVSGSKVEVESVGPGGDGGGGKDRSNFNSWEEHIRVLEVRVGSAEVRASEAEKNLEEASAAMPALIQTIVDGHRQELTSLREEVAEGVTACPRLSGAVPRENLTAEGDSEENLDGSGSQKLTALLVEKDELQRERERLKKDLEDAQDALEMESYKRTIQAGQYEFAIEDTSQDLDQTRQRLAEV